MAMWNPFGKKSDDSTDSATDGSPQSAPISNGEAGASGEPAGGILGRFRTALKKTVSVLNTDIRDLVGKDGRLVDEDFSIRAVRFAD